MKAFPRLDRPLNATARVFLVVATALFPPGLALADDVGDPVAGHRLAAAWCSNCHAVDGSERVIATGAPSFRSIAANRAITPLALRAFLQTPHQRMPDLNLSNDELDNLIAYILRR